MDRLLDRLQTNSEVSDSSESAGDDESSGTVEWRNISIKSRRPDSTSEPEPTEAAAPTGTDSKGDLAALGSERLVRTVLDALSTPALVVDSDGQIVHLNDVACRLFETDASGAVGDASTALHDGVALVPRVLATGEAIHDYRETVTVSGIRYNLSRTVVPLTTTAGSVGGAIEIVRSWSD